MIPALWLARGVDWRVSRAGEGAERHPITFALLGESPHFLSCSLCSKFEVLGQIGQMNALGTFLTLFDPHEGKGDLARRDLSDQLGWREVSEIVSANLIDRDDGFAAILSHQKKCRIHVGCHLQLERSNPRDGINLQLRSGSGGRTKV